MVLKGNIREDLKEAVKNREELKSSVLRLLLAAIFNKEKEKRYKLILRRCSGLRLSLSNALSKEKPELSGEELEEESQLNDEEVIDVISSEAKKRKESIVEFGKGKRMDLVEKEKKELEILEKYLPEQLSEEEIKKLVKEAIDKTVAKEIHPVKSAEGGVSPKAKQFNRVKDMGKPSSRFLTDVPFRRDIVNAKQVKNSLLGKVMQEVMPKVKGKADGSLVSKVVKELLAQ